MNRVLNKSLTALTLISAVLMSGCTTQSNTWTDAQREKLSSIAVSPVEYGGESYQTPRAISSGAATGNLANVVNFNGLPIGLLAGALIDGTVAAVQQTKFNSKYSTHFPLIEASIRKNQGQADAVLLEELKKVPYVAERLKSDSDNKLVIKINKHGLSRYGTTTVEDMSLVYYVNASATLSNSKTNEEFMNLNDVSSNSEVKKMDEVVASPSILEQMQQNAYKGILANIALQLKMRSAAPAVEQKSTQAAAAPSVIVTQP